MIGPAKLYTVDEFEAYIHQPENQDRRFELIHGRIVEKMPTQQHGIIVIIIAGEIYIYFLQNPIGRVGTEIRHRMPDDDENDRLPDLAIYLDTETPIVDKGPVLHMPDFAIEVQSPDDSMEELRERADYFLNNGTKLVWLVYPKTRTVEVCTLKNERVIVEIFKDHETLSSEELLPGFTLTLKKIFGE